MGFGKTSGFHSGLGSLNTIREENLAFSGTVFNLKHSPVFIQGVYVDGKRTENDYTIEDNVLTFLVSKDNVWVSIVYRIKQ